MAKYSRFDPKNKKRDRNKSRSLNKDLRIREEGKNVITKKELMEYAEVEIEREELEFSASQSPLLTPEEEDDLEDFISRSNYT
jgi:hypothetical protein